MEDLENTRRLLQTATNPEEVFGSVDLVQLKVAFRRLAQLVHPDCGGDANTFARLNELRNQAEERLRTKDTGTVVRTKTKEYKIGGLIATGDLADVYTSDGGAFKIVRSPADNDLMKMEADTLKTLYPDGQTDEGFYRYLPKLLDTFEMKGTSGSRRRVNVLTSLPYYSLVEVKNRLKVLDYRDAVWIYRRVLEGIGFVHRAGIVHGAVIPPHVMVHPVTHGARIVDWCYAVRNGRVKALSKPWKSFYPLEVVGKMDASTSTDIYMATACMVWLVGGDVVTRSMPGAVPREVQGFLRGCMIENPKRRPDDAWALHGELSRLLERLVGRPKYRQLGLPVKER